jgi:hypothetical protein
MRLSSKKAATQQLASTPHLFEFSSHPSTPYIAVPRHSSEDRDYVPMAYFNPEVVTNDAVSIVPDAPLWMFGLLQSRPFSVWNKSVSGRIKSDTRISNTITYNNFPMPDVSNANLDLVESNVREVLGAREKHPDSSLADLYGANSMPADLRKSHKELDKVVLGLYGLGANASDDEILEVLFTMYAEQSKSSKS